MLPINSPSFLQQHQILALPSSSLLSTPQSFIFSHWIVESEQSGVCMCMYSVMDIFRQEIIGQELLFRSQVRELHRLYWTQKNMMNDIRMNGIKTQAFDVFCKPSLDRKGGNAFGENVGDLLKNHPGILGLGSTGCGVEVIELEDSMEEECCREVNGAFDVAEFRTTVPETLSLFGSESGMMVGNNKNCMPSVVQMEDEEDRRFHEHVSSVGLGDDSRLASVDILLSNKHVCRPQLIDLNIPNEDECYHVQINDHLVEAASPSMNFSIDHHQVILELDGPTKSDKIPFTTKPVTANTTSTTSSAYDEDSVKPSQTISRDSAAKPRNLEECGGDVLSSHHSTAEARKFCAEHTSNDMINISECSSYEKSTEEPATLSTNDDSVITQLHSPKHKISYIGKSKDGGRDLTIAAAAEALVTISSGRSELLEELPCAEPQNSSDSFECMAMQLSEVQKEDQIQEGDMMSLNDTQKVEKGMRLRRGRRLRDFRKEILPGLVSLSRHEICEDLYSIGYTLRKNAPRSARRNWFSPTRSRRRF